MPPPSFEGELDEKCAARRRGEGVAVGGGYQPGPAMTPRWHDKDGVIAGGVACLSNICAQRSTKAKQAGEAKGRKIISLILMLDYFFAHFLEWLPEASQFYR